MNDDARWLAVAAAIAARGRPLSRPNPSVGAILVRDGRMLARGWTQPHGRPHAEASLLGLHGTKAQGATLYVTLEPCAHKSERGPACADLVALAKPDRVVIGCADPDPRTAGAGIARIRAAGIPVELVESLECRASLAGYLSRQTLGRPHVTLKVAMSQDGALARPPGEDQWLTGEAARAHVHSVRATMDAILVGGGTLRADNPRLDVRLPGLEARSPNRWVLTRSGSAPEGWHVLPTPQAITALNQTQWLYVEGGAQTARAFLHAGLVDCLHIYRAPTIITREVPRLPELTAGALEVSTDWQRNDSRMLGMDKLDVYGKKPCSPE